MFKIGRTLRILAKYEAQIQKSKVQQFQRCITTIHNKYCQEKPQEKEDAEKQNNKKYREQREKQLMIWGSFEHMQDKNKQTYLDMIRVFENKDKHRRNHVEFIYAALKNMELFGVNKDLAVYKALIDVMPKGKFIPENSFQVEFQHYPKQQVIFFSIQILKQQLNCNILLAMHDRSS